MMPARNRQAAPAAHNDAHLPERQQGIALVLVLWLIVLLTVIGASHARNVHVETRLAHNQLDTARAHAMAEAGVNLAILELTGSKLDNDWHINGDSNRMVLDDGHIDISIRHAGGLLDLNAADSVQLRNVIAAAGVEDSAAAALVDAILDWRDTDNMTHINGAEDADYRAAGLDWSCRDGPFASVDELRYVMGMTTGLYHRLAPYLTVYSGSANVNLDYAPAWLHSALTGTDTELVTDSPVVAGFAKGTYHINVQSTTGAGARSQLEAVVRTTAGEHPYTILAWHMPVTIETSGN